MPTKSKIRIERKQVFLLLLDSLVPLRFTIISVLNTFWSYASNLTQKKNPFKNKISAFNVSQRVGEFMVDAFWPEKRRVKKKLWSLFLGMVALVAWNICVKWNWDVNRASEVWAVGRRTDRHKFREHAKAGEKKKVKWHLNACWPRHCFIVYQTFR